MDEVSRPRSKELSDMSEDQVPGSSLVCELEEFHRHEMAVQSNLLNVSGAGAKRKRIVGKRSDSVEKETDDIDIQNEEGYTLVQKKTKKPKTNAEDNTSFKGYNGRKNTKNVPDLSAIEVCVTSNEVLPKQIGLAKLLKSENIPNIKEIKYKTPYKVFMKFETRADAEKLLSNSKLSELGYKCRFTNEVSFTYGLVRYIEKEIQEEELLKSFSAEFEIVSVKRLKRMNENGIWSECETVRLCFKSPTLPQYIYGYDCRFKVDPYTFPVNQCSVCWKFGHLARMCPSSRRKCPKCCGEHENCETNNYRCINCKGNHMAFEKKCPVYLKEKKIRQIMCEQNCTYKVAFTEFSGSRKSYYVREDTPLPDKSTSQDATWEEPVETETFTHNVWTKITENESMDDSDDNKSSEEESQMLGSINQNKNMKRSKRQKKTSRLENRRQSEDQMNANGKSMKFDTPNENEAQKKKKSEDSKNQGKEGRREQEKKESSSDKFSYIFSKLKNIFLAKNSFEEKIKLIIKFLIDEVLKFLVGVVSNGEIIRKLINLFNYG